MSLTISPPVRPRVMMKTDHRPKKHYTIHSHSNDAFTLKANERAKTCVIAFHQHADALFIGGMLETYFMRQKELPDTRDVGSLILPMAETTSLNFLFIQEWSDFDELKMLCTKNILDAVSVSSLSSTKQGYSFTGVVYKFEADSDFYRTRFEELLPLNTDPDNGPY
jgi:hypothetical protein